MRRLLLTLLFAIGLPFAAHAQFYVCASNCVNGATPSDSNPGTLASPFLTIGKAQTSMQGSGTKKTIIQAGTYTMGTSQFTGSSNWSFTSSDNGETWVSYPGASVIISGGGSPGVNNYIPTVASGTTGLTFEGLTFQNTGGNGGTHSGNGIGFTITGNLSTNQGITLKYNTFTGCTDYCVDLRGAVGVTIDSNHCQNVVSANVDLGSCFASAAGTGGGATNVTVSHNLCENTYYACADFNGISGSNAIHDITYDSNIVVNPCLKITGLSDTDCGGLYMSDRNLTSTNMVIKNNVIMGSNLDILDSNTMTSKGIYLDDCASNVTVTGNLLFGNAGLFQVFIHGGNNDHFTNNVFVLGSGGSSGAEIGGYQSASGICAGGSGGTMSGNTFQNNVVWFQGNWPNAGAWESLSTSPTNGPSISNNLYYMQTGVTFRNLGGGGAASSYTDSSPIVCGPSMGVNPLGNITPVKLWGMLANGVISSWQQLVPNPGPNFRSCAAGGF